MFKFTTSNDSSSVCSRTPLGRRMVRRWSRMSPGNSCVHIVPGRDEDIRVACTTDRLVMYHVLLRQPRSLFNTDALSTPLLVLRRRLQCSSSTPIVLHRHGCPCTAISTTLLLQRCCFVHESAAAAGALLLRRRRHSCAVVSFFQRHSFAALPFRVCDSSDECLEHLPPFISQRCCLWNNNITCTLSPICFDVTATQKQSLLLRNLDSFSTDL